MADARRIQVCAARDVPDGFAVRVSRTTVGASDDIAVFNDGGRFYALNDTCTHALASLAEGWVEDGEVECPLHGGRFELSTGTATALPATRDAVTHRVEVGDDGMIVLVADADVRQ
ncbi:bifunctional 3-phenylpropionate/cinnamic acid dioxygenase ferredoxin subunit [Micromonospora sp. SCSIO 07396]